jgi:hypothetical protein
MLALTASIGAVVVPEYECHPVVEFVPCGPIRTAPSPMAQSVEQAVS